MNNSIPLISSRVVLLIIINWLATGCHAVRQEAQKAPLPINLASSMDIVPESKQVLQLASEPLLNLTSVSAKLIVDKFVKQTAVNMTIVPIIRSLVKQAMANTTAASSEVMAQNGTSVRRFDKQQETIQKLQTAQSKQDNQNKLYYQSFKQDVDDELDDFPLILDNNSSSSIGGLKMESSPTQKSKLAEQTIQRAKNQELLNDIIINDELDEERQRKNETGLDPGNEIDSSKELSEKASESRLQEESSMSVSEIISKRFKDQIKVNQISTPEQIQDMVIKAPEHANTDFDSNWYVSFLEEKRAQPLRNGAISKLFQHVYRHFPTKSELLRTSQLLATNLKRKLTNAGNMILAQTTSSSVNGESAPSRTQVKMEGASASNKSFQGDSRRNIVLLVMVIVQTVICCLITKGVFVPVSSEAALELNYRDNQRDRGKTYIMRDPIVNIFMVKRINEKQAQRQADKKNPKKLRRSSSMAPGASGLFDSGVSGTMRSGYEYASNQSGGSRDTGKDNDAESRNSKAGDAEGRPGSGIGAKVSSRAKKRRQKPRKDNPHLKARATNE